MLDNASDRYISQPRSPSSGRALLAPETQRDRRMRPIRARIAGKETDPAARNLSGKGRCRFAPDKAQFRTRGQTLGAVVASGTTLACEVRCWAEGAPQVLVRWVWVSGRGARDTSRSSQRGG